MFKKLFLWVLLTLTLLCCTVLSTVNSIEKFKQYKDNYDLSKVESYLGTVKEIKTNIEYINYRCIVNYETLIEIPNGNTLSLNHKNDKPTAKAGDSVTVYTNPDETVWRLSPERVMYAEMDIISYFLAPTIIGIFSMLVIALSAINLKVS